MLQFLRKKSQSLIIQIIVVIIALVFIFWGVGTNMMNKQNTALRVNGEEFSFPEYQRAYEQSYARLARQFGGTIPKGLADSLDIKQQVISQLSREALLRQGGAKMGLMVSNFEIQDALEDIVQFQEDGTFSLERYEATLSASRLSPAKYEDSLRRGLLADKTIAAITSFGVAAADFEIEELYNIENESIQLSYTVISPDAFQTEINPSDEELDQWYQANSNRYKTEPMIKLAYLPFTYEQIGDKITIDDQAIQTYYDKHISEYRAPEKRHARHILFKVDQGADEKTRAQQRQNAEEVLQKAKAGENFAALASEYSEGPTAAKGGDLGFFTAEQMVSPFSDTVFAMTPGAISDIVETIYGYHIIKLEEIKEGEVTALEDVRDEITVALKLETAQPMAFELANKSYEEIISSGSLAAYLKNHPDATVVETDFFSKNAPPDGIASNPDFLDRAFSLKQGELSSLTKIDQGYVIISATTVQEPHVRELKEVKERALTDYQVEKAKEKARSRAEQVIDELNTEDAAFTAVARNHGLTPEQSGLLKKNGANDTSSFPRSLLQQAFQLSASSPVPDQPGSVGEDFYVFKLDQRRPPENAMNEEDRERYKQMMVQFKQQQILDAWLKNRQADADIWIHQSLRIR